MNIATRPAWRPASPFGSVRGFGTKNPQHPEHCMSRLRYAMERVGYREEETLFGAPYDFRHAPPTPGQPSEVYTRYFRQLSVLVETISKKNQHKPAILIGHSFGGIVAFEFLRNTPLPWRKKFIKHLVLIAPTWYGGFIESTEHIASGSNILYIPAATALSLRPMWRSFESSMVTLPSPRVFAHKPLVITKQRNYSAYDTVNFLTTIGFADGITPFEKRVLPKMRYFEAPMVPMTCINGVGTRTAEQLVYRADDFDVAPEVVDGDGDGTINLVTMLAFEDEIGKKPGQKEHFKSVKIAKASHSRIIVDEWALKVVLAEILEANR